MGLSLLCGETMEGGSSNTLQTLVQSRKPIAELIRTDLEKDTVKKCDKGLKCVFCDHLKIFAGGPSRVRDHLLNSGSGNHIKSCTPSPIWVLFGYNGTRKWLQS